MRRRHLGLVLLAMATLFSGSVATPLRLFPLAVIGVILFVTEPNGPSALAMARALFSRNQEDATGKDLLAQVRFRLMLPRERLEPHRGRPTDYGQHIIPATDRRG